MKPGLLLGAEAYWLLRTQGVHTATALSLFRYLSDTIHMVHASVSLGWRMLTAGHVYFGDVSGRGFIHINCWISSQHGKLANICDFFSTWLTFPWKGFFP